MAKATLNIGQTLTSGSYNYRVTKVLNETGGQGGVYLAKDAAGKEWVIKWYWQNDDKQSGHIRRMAADGIPPQLLAVENTHKIKFIWPLVYLSDNQSFGYVMEHVNTNNRFNYESIVWHDTPGKGKKLDYKELCDLSISLIAGFNALHGAGYCYMDMSRDNISFGTDGSIIVFDPDNIVVNDETRLDPKTNTAPIAGTSGFIAPEILRRESNPNRKTDLWQLSIFLFLMWVKHHPFDGELVFEDDKYNDINLLCINPQFIFDNRNGNPNCIVGNDEDFQYAKKWWALLPKPMKDLFMEAFTIACDPDRRIQAHRWNRALEDTKSNHLVRCDSCGKYTGREKGFCISCNRKITLPPISLGYLGIFEGSKVVKTLSLTKDTKLHGHHLSSWLPPSELFAEIIPNPNISGVFGLKNCTQNTWICIREDGGTFKVPPGVSMVLKHNNKFKYDTPHGKLGVKFKVKKGE